MKREIICLSTTAWDNHFTRKQQVMSRLGDCEIAYVNPPVTYLSRFRDSAAAEYAKRAKQAPVKVSDHITVWSLPAVYPFYNQYRGINRKNQKKFVLPLMRRIMSHHGFEKPVLWIYHPSSADILGSFDHGPVVYDCIDRHSAYRGRIDPEVVDAMERDLATRSDRVFATAQGLYDTLVSYNEKTSLIPNGVNYELFSKAHTGRYDRPEEFKNIERPIAGFVGALQECIDYDLLGMTAKACPGLMFVFIGPVIAGADLSPRLEQSNVLLLPQKPQSELPRYIAHFDCCLNPFRSGRLSRDVSPLKFYEYLATGKPIVSTPQPLQVGAFSDVVRICHTDGEFAESCMAAVRDRDPVRIEKQLAHAQGSSWNARVEEMRKSLEGIL